MMGLGKADTETMSLWEYESRLYHWNEAHGDGNDITPPDPELTQRLIDKINSSPELLA
jgi:hypothetical protein